MPPDAHRRHTSAKTAGPEDLAERLRPNHTVLSDAGLLELAAVAFRASLKCEEGRLPSFQLFAPLRDGPQPLLDLRFSPPVPYGVESLHRICPGVPLRPYAFVVEEWSKGLRLLGAGRVEYSGFAALRGRLDYHGGTLLPGLALHVGGPAKLRAVLFSRDVPVTYLELKEGRLSRSYDNAFSPIFLPMCQAAAAALSEAAQAEGGLLGLVKASLGRVFSLAVAAAHGGMFVFLPPGFGLKEAAGLCHVGVGVSWPNLGQVARNLLDGEDAHYARHVEQWDTATRVTAQASCVDGAVILDAALNMLGFRVELCVAEDERLPECVALPPDVATPEPDGPVDLTDFGTRHRTAARFCAKVPGAVVVVVSQDGEMREFTRLLDGRIGVCGPVLPLSVASPLF